jgi:hypothetical protein
MNHSVIIPTIHEVNLNKVFDGALLKAYRTFPDVQKLADEIHVSRLQSGPACSSCIDLALKQLKFTYGVGITIQRLES